MPKKKIDRSDLELVKKMSDKLLDISNDLIFWCAENCPYVASCLDFTGACAIQTVKSVAFWGTLVLKRDAIAFLKSKEV